MVVFNFPISTFPSFLLGFHGFQGSFQDRPERVVVLPPALSHGRHGVPAPLSQPCTLGGDSFDPSLLAPKTAYYLLCRESSFIMKANDRGHSVCNMVMWLEGGRLSIWHLAQSSEVQDNSGGAVGHKYYPPDINQVFLSSRIGSLDQGEIYGKASSSGAMSHGFLVELSLESTHIS